jgi:putative peptide zinc metalloprotease protein
MTGRIERIQRSGSQQLPSPALGYAGGGNIQTESNDEKGTKASEPFFEIRVRPDAPEDLMVGQRVVVRMRTANKPLAVQWWRSLLQLVQRRYQM